MRILIADGNEDLADDFAILLAEAFVLPVDTYIDYDGAQALIGTSAPS